MKTPAAFLDKDGTLIVDVPFNTDPARIALMPNAAAGVRRLVELGYRTFVLSNQSGLAFGMFDEPQFARTIMCLRSELHVRGVEIDGIYWCPHHPVGNVEALAVPCECRKPSPGMLLRAAREHDLDLERSWMFGDILDDVEAAHRAGCRAAFIDNGGETEFVLNDLRRPEVWAKDLADAAEQVALFDVLHG